MKNSCSPIIQKNYDIDEYYTNKDNKIQNNDKFELKNSEKKLIKENVGEIKKFNEKESLNDKNDNSFEKIVINDENRLNTDAIDHNKIIEKIMDDLGKNINRIKKLDIDISNTEKENNLKKNNLTNKQNQEILNQINYTSENDESLNRYKNSKKLSNL